MKKAPNIRSYLNFQNANVSDVFFSESHDASRRSEYPASEHAFSTMYRLAVSHFKHAGRKAALIQRSCGYSLRPTLTINEIASAIKAIKAKDPQCTILVDNCYGEFTEVQEPGQVADTLPDLYFMQLICIRP